MLKRLDEFGIIIWVLLYRIGLPSNTGTRIALYGRSPRIELHSNSIRMTRAFALKSSCIRSMTCFPTNRATPRYGDSKDSVLQTCWMICLSSASEVVIISNRQTDTRTASWKTH